MAVLRRAVVPNEVRLPVSEQLNSKRASERKAAISDVDWFASGVSQIPKTRKSFSLYAVFFFFLNKSGIIREAGILMFIYRIKLLPPSISAATSVRK